MCVLVCVWGGEGGWGGDGAGWDKFVISIYCTYIQNVLPLCHYNLVVLVPYVQVI